MSTQRPHPIDRRTVERLLGGDAAGAYSSHPPLASLLAAAAAPGRPGELASESECVATFRAAQLAGRPRRDRSMITSVLLRVLTVKAMIVALVTMAAGGAVFAATGHTLSDPLNHRRSVVATRSAGAHVDARRARTGTGGSGSSSGPTRSHGDTPSSSLAGLCRAYSAGNKAERGKALESPAFTVLITAAGGRDRVDAYCAGLLASPSPSAGNDEGKKPDDQHPGGDSPGRDGDHSTSPKER
jgi:hypothetical protein